MIVTEEHAEAQRAATVAVLLAARRLHLATGANPLTHWDRLHARLRAATRTTTSVPEWGTTLLRGLGVAAPGRAAARALAALAACVPADAAPAWLDLVERESAYLIAATRLAADEARAAAKRSKKKRARRAGRTT